MRAGEAVPHPAVAGGENEAFRVHPQHGLGQLVPAGLGERVRRDVGALRGQPGQGGRPHPVEHQAGQRHGLRGQPVDEVRRLAQRVRLGRGDHDEGGPGCLQQLVRLLRPFPEAAEHGLQRADEG